jgi:hypothetical protein
MVYLNSNDQTASRAARHDGFCAPQTFAEFHERYPTVIRARLRRRWGFRNEELEDCEQEVCVHLLSLPKGSIFRSRGCVDRIATYDPAKRGGNSEPLFIDYVNLIIDNYCKSQLQRNQNKLVSNTIGVVDLIRLNKDGIRIDEESAIAQLSAALSVSTDPLSGISWQQLLRRAQRAHPLLPYACLALVTYSTRREAAASLQMTPERFWYVMRFVRALVVNDQATLGRFGRRKKWSLPKCT